MIYEKVAGGIKIRGAKKGGGGEARAAQETPDNLKSTSYAKILDLIGEGEIEGLEDGLRSVYLNGTPVENADGSRNFQGISFDFRNGTQDQTYIQGFPAVERPYSVGVQLREATPWVRAITDRQLSAVRVMVGTNRLTSQNMSNGDLNGSVIEYKIEVQAGEGAWQTYLTTSMTGKTTSSYRRSHRIDLPAITSGTGWLIRVTRLTPDSTASSLSNDMVVDLFTEIIDAKMRYPMSALAGITVEASQFGSAIPTRAYRVKLKRIRVPSNYDPETRDYTGAWDGSFKVAWSDNPAWALYDLITSDVYGLAQRIPSAYVDKWTLYQIGRYCDELVPDGRGGMEPRFSCNVYMQQSAEAYKVLQDFVSIFRGMIFWSHSTATTVADMPRDPVYTYTQGNVIDGRFIYTGSRLADMYTSAMVSYSDLEDFGRQKVITVVADSELVAKYGYRPTEITAFGCTSEGQARRQGEWVLMTAHQQTRGVTFSVGLEGVIASPGQLVRVADNLIAGRRIGGRILSATATKLVLDSVDGVTVGQEVTALLPSGASQTRTITAINSEHKVLNDAQVEVTVTEVTVGQAFSEIPLEETVWALDGQDLRTQLFTILSVTEGADPGTFDITGIEYAPGKYNRVDYGTALDTRPITVVPAKVINPPATISLSEYNVVSQGITRPVGVIEWSQVPEAEYYNLQWRRDNSDWVNVGRIYGTRYEIESMYAGVYVARVQAVNAAKIASIWKNSVSTPLTGEFPAPAAVSFLNATSQVFGIKLEWGYPSEANIIERIQIFASPTANFADAELLTDLAYPQNTYNMTGLAAGVERWFWARYVDKNGLAGPEYPVGGGVRGTASSQSSEILSYLSGQIASSHLTQQLLSAIGSGGGSSVGVEVIQEALSAMYTVKTSLTADNRTYISGIGVGVENNDGIIESQVLVAADRFAVIHPNGQGIVVPFTVQNGQVFISDAFIGDGTISSAKITDVLQSDASNSLGEKLFSVNMRTGVMSLNSESAVGRLKIGNSKIEFIYANGVKGVELGVF